MNLDEFTSKGRDTISFFSKDIASLRTGRATPALVEDIQVEAYETKTPISQLASINSPDAKTLVIQPWDKSILKNIEKAIQQSEISIQPVVEGDMIRMNMPPLTEENRKDLVKLLHQKAEAAKVSLRQLREKQKKAVGAAEESGDIAEDEKMKLQKELDEQVKKFSDEIKEISDSKEKEIMTI